MPEMTTEVHAASPGSTPARRWTSLTDGPLARMRDFG
jgi:hypothetical protein